MRKYSKYIVVAGALAAVAVPSAAMAAGNSDNAHACQQGGWQNLVRQDGTGFKNTGDCVSYAAQGGILNAKSTGGSENFSEDSVGSLPTTFSGGTINSADYAPGEDAPGFVKGATVPNGGTGGSILAAGPYFNGFAQGTHFLFTGWGQNAPTLTFDNPTKSVQVEVENNKTDVPAHLTLSGYDAANHVVDTASADVTGTMTATLKVTSTTANIKSVKIATDDPSYHGHYGLGFTNIVWS